MKRYAIRTLLTAAAVLLSVSALRAQDKVIYRDTAAKDKKVIEQNGTLKSESINTVVIKPNIGADKTINAQDVIDIIYEPKPAWKTDYNKAIAAERTTAEKAKPGSGAWRAALGTALKDYQATLAKVSGPVAVQRHLQYKIAMLTATLAGDEKAEMKKAADLLAKFQSAHSNNWQIFTAVARLAKLYEDLGELEKAVGVFDAMKKLPGMSADGKAELDGKAIDYLLRAKKHAEAAKRLEDVLTKLPKTSPKYDELKMQLLICNANTPAKFKDAVGELQKMTKNEKDPSRKALAHNTLGDVYFSNNQPKDAAYEYLFVDLIYFQDKSQHVRAIEKLIQTFKEMKMMDKAREYTDKLEKIKGK